MTDLLKKPDLLKKGKKFEWSEKAEESFQILKIKLTTAPVLILPDTSKDFVIFCDASLLGLGCVLMQDGHAVAYASHQLKPHEKIIQLGGKWGAMEFEGLDVPLFFHTCLN